MIGGLPDVVTIMEGKVRRTVGLMRPSVGGAQGQVAAQSPDHGELPTHPDGGLRLPLVTLTFSGDSRV